MALRDKFSRSKTAMIVIGICLLVLGLLFCLEPAFGLKLVTLITGWAFVIAAVVTLIDFFVHKQTRRHIDILYALLELILGLVILLNPAASLVVVLTIIGVVIIVTGIADIADAVQFKSVEGSRWGVWLALGIITLLLGVIVVLMPLAFGITLMIIAGIALIFDGITEIIVGIQI